MEHRLKPNFVRIKYWVDTYGNSGSGDDRRSVDEFLTCEARELAESLRTELIALSRGGYDEAALNLLVGIKRKEKHGSYEAWSKLMLIWLSNYRG